MAAQRLIHSFAILAITTGTIVSLLGNPEIAKAQNTRTWATPGANSAIDNGANWVGGVAPNFAGDSTTDSALFSASTNTAVTLRDTTTGDPFSSVTFDANAPAYTFSSAPLNTVNDLVILPAGNMTNNSNFTQTFTAIPDVSINATNGNKSTLNAASGNASSHLAFDLNQLKWVSTGGSNPNNWSSVSGAFDTRAVTVGGSGVLQKTGGGTLFITGDSSANAATIQIGSPTGTDFGPFGAIRISNGNALGGSGSLRIYGNANSDGRLELTNNITTAGGSIIVYGRQNGTGNGVPYDNSLNPAVLNVSGNNTITNTLSFNAGGGSYNFASNSGLLTIQSNMGWGLAGDRYFTFQGAGNGLITGNLSSSIGGVPIVKYGTGTLTLAGTANSNVSNIMIRGGTLAIANGAAFTFEASSDLLVPPVVVLQNNSTLDVSAVSGGFTLTQNLLGNSGNLVGDLHMAAGTQVLPGSTMTYDPVNTYSVASIAAGVGQLHFHNGLDMSAGSQMVWHLGALSTTSPGTNFDQLQVDGALTLGGSSSLSIDLSLLAGGSQPGGGDPFWNSSHTWTIISNTNNPGSSNFASLLNNVVATGTFTTSVSSGTLLGDVNGDHVVNGLDIAVVASHWLLTGATLGQGDANGDGTVNGLDIALIASHWLSTGGSGGGIVLTYTPSAGNGTAVPEPSTAALAALGLVSLIALRKYRR